MSSAELQPTTGPEIASRMVSGQVVDREFDVGAMIEAINRPERETDSDRLLDGRLQGHKLIGFGEEKPTCGDPFHLFCECCGSTHTTSDVCRRSACPRCASEWAREAATNMASRLWALKKYRNVTKDTTQRLHHVVLSPADYVAGETDDREQDWWLQADDPLERTKETCKEILDDHMDAEGVLLYHEFRAREKEDPYDVEDSRGVWKDLVFSDYEWDEIKPRDGSTSEGDQPRLKRAPHFHAIVVDDEIPGPGVTDTIYEETGWVIHRIADARGISISGQVELATIAAYCLSHVCLLEGEQRNETATWWFGRNFGGEHQVTAPDELVETFDFIVRAIAPRVLDLDYQMLVCPVDRPEKLIQEDPYGHVDIDGAVGELEMRGAGHVAFLNSDGDEFDSPAPPGGDPPEPDLGDSWDPASPVGVDDLDRLEEFDVDDARAEAETSRETRCAGRLLSIAKASSYLENPSWMEHAKYSEETREVYESYADDPDHWVGN